MQVFFDVETIPGQSPQAILASEDVKPPGTLKKQESIAAWWACESEQAIRDNHLKQSLDGGCWGEIISIAATTNEGQEWVRCRQQGQSEAELLQDFGRAVQGWLDTTAFTGPDGWRWPLGDPWFIAHNAAFDVGYLWRRCVVNNVRLPFKLPAPSSRAGQHYGDTMTLWAGFGGRISLDNLCKALGIESPKGDMTGAQVYPAWQAGEYERIAQYNLDDARACAQVWQRLNGGLKS